MKYKLERKQIALKEQLLFPWDWVKFNYNHLDGWEINRNRQNLDRHLEEMAKDFGPQTIPHRER